MASKEKWKGRAGTEENICSTEQSLSSWNVDKQHKRQVVMETQSANTQELGKLDMVVSTLNSGT